MNSKISVSNFKNKGFRNNFKGFDSFMTYDLEKYRDKREKVLGVKKKGISFGAWAATVSAIIIVGLISMVAPKSIAYFTTRNLDDVIYKLSGDQI